MQNNLDIKEHILYNSIDTKFKPEKNEIIQLRDTPLRDKTILLG